MEFPSLNLREYPADLLTLEYVLSGQLAPLGPLLAYLDQADRGILTLKNAQAEALDSACLVDAFQAEELIVTKNDIIAVRLREAVSQATVHLLPRRERLLVFTPRFVVQAAFHCGPDTRVGDFFEATPGRWAISSEARLYPLRPSKHPVFGAAPLLLLNKRHIHFYQAAK
jgi:hypothetical protein